jgi:hypothetical protein
VSGGVVRKCESAKVRKGINASVLRASVVLLAGVAMTVIVAWSGMLLSTPIKPGMVTRSTFSGTTLIDDVEYRVGSVVRDGITSRQIFASAAWNPDARASFGNRTNWIDERASGWPVRALRYRFRFGERWNGDVLSRTAVREQGALRIFSAAESVNAQTGLARRVREHVLPVMPMWPGFVACVAFWSGAIWVVWYGPQVVRSMLRRRGGRCVRCEYDVRQLQTCPECGTSVPKAPVASTAIPMPDAGNTLIGGSA